MKLRLRGLIQFQILYFTRVQYLKLLQAFEAMKDNIKILQIHKRFAFRLLEKKFFARV